jgi:hypothetical protein
MRKDDAVRCAHCFLAKRKGVKGLKRKRELLIKVFTISIDLLSK